MIIAELPPPLPPQVRYVDSTPQIYDIYPLDFRVPLIVGSFLSAGVVSALVVLVTTETNRLAQKDETLNIPVDKPDERVAVPEQKEDGLPLTQTMASVTTANTPILDVQHYRNIGNQIIGGFAVSSRSQMIVAPSRCGKTTVMYFLLEEFFKRYPQMQCWVWQGKQIEPVHPRIPRERHTLYQMGQSNLTAVEAVYNIYENRQRGDSSRTPTKLIITDWQSIKDGLEVSDQKEFKKVAAKIMTIANNGAALGVTVVGDTQSPNVDDWGLGSGSLRDNFDIYGVSRIAWVDGYAKGDIKALPKLISNKDIIPTAKDRRDLLTEFEQLRKGMEKGLINTSIVLSTVGICRLGITPEFERKNLVWGGYERHICDVGETQESDPELSENARTILNYIKARGRVSGDALKKWCNRNNLPESARKPAIQELVASELIEISDDGFYCVLGH